MASTRKHAHKRQDIFKSSYDELIKSAKRKHPEEFYVFKNVIGEQQIFSECCVDAYNNHMEHWNVNGEVLTLMMKENQVKIKQVLLYFLLQEEG